jgi:hypothetical protein
VVAFQHAWAPPHPKRGARSHALCLIAVPCPPPAAPAPLSAAGRGIPYALLDGANEGNRPLRNALFGISGKRAVYPQVFLRTGDAEYAFVGTYDSLHEVNEATGADGAASGAAAFDALFAGVPRVAVSADAPAVRFMDAAAEGANAAMAAASAAASKARFSATAGGGGGGAGATPLADSPTPSTPLPAAAPPAEEPPAEAAVPAAVAAPAAAAAASSAAPVQPPPSLSPAAAAAGWEMHTDPTGDTYYWHHASRQSSWVDPGLAVVGGGSADAAASAAPLAPDAVWVPLHDPRRGNKRYFYNRVTGQSVWRLPVAAAAQ